MYVRSMALNNTRLIKHLQTAKRQYIFITCSPT